MDKIPPNWIVTTSDGCMAMAKALTSDSWNNAILALIANVPSDPKPLAAMLRGAASASRTGVNAVPPPDILDTLAELLVPGDPEYLGCKLEIVETKGLAKAFRALDTITGIAAIGERSGFRHKAYWRALASRLMTRK